MKKRIFLILLIFSCAPKERIQKPENLMTHTQMVYFLTDVNIINASRGYRTLDGTTYVTVHDSTLYSKHHVDSLQFANSNAYYASRPKEYIKIFEAVEKHITRVKDSLDTKIKQASKESN